MIINLDYLKEIAGGMDEFVVEILEKYVDTVPRDFDALKGVVKNGGPAQIRKAAHKLISSTRIVGAEEITKRLEIIEKEPESESYRNSVNILLGEIEPLIHQSIEEIKEEIK